MQEPCQFYDTPRSMREAMIASQVGQWLYSKSQEREVGVIKVGVCWDGDERGENWESEGRMLYKRKY